MSSRGHPDRAGNPAAYRFATTHWSVVLAAGRPAGDGSQEALSSLCTTYWYPLYAFIRRQGHAPEEAQDLTQEFFTRLLEKDFLAHVDRSRGKFRTFLLAACKHFLANEQDRRHAQKRGGRLRIFSIDVAAAESRYHGEPAHVRTPDRLFDRRWALTLLETVLGRLRTEAAATDKAALFDRLKGSLTGDRGADTLSEAAAALGMAEGAVKTAVHRLRRRYRELLREEIGRTVQSPDAVEDEIRDLFAALAS